MNTNVEMILRNAQNDMKNAENEFEEASKNVKRIAQGNINLYSPTAISDTRKIVDEAKDACENLYTTCQSFVVTIDDICRPRLNELDIDTISRVYKIIKDLNKNSDIEHKVNIIINGVDFGDASVKYSPTIQSKSIEKFWETTYLGSPEYSQHIEREKDSRAEELYDFLSSQEKEWFKVSEITGSEFWYGPTSNQLISVAALNLIRKGKAVCCEYGGAYYKALPEGREFSEEEKKAICDKFIEEQKRIETETIKKAEEERRKKELAENQRKKEIEEAAQKKVLSREKEIIKRYETAQERKNASDIFKTLGGIMFVIGLVLMFADLVTGITLTTIGWFCLFIGTVLHNSKGKIELHNSKLEYDELMKYKKATKQDTEGK